MNSPNTPEPPEGGIRAAVVVDQLELLRVGIESVLTQLDIHVSGSFARATDGLRAAREGHADLLIVGKHADLKSQHTLREAKNKISSLKVMVLLDQTEMPDVARLLSIGADALLLRSAKSSELIEALERLGRGERVVASALAIGTIGRVGPKQDMSAEEANARSGLSLKELEVLAELASGATYQEIANTLIVTHATVKTHLVHIYAKLGVRNRQEAVARALSLGLLG